MKQVMAAIMIMACLCGRSQMESERINSLRNYSEKQVSGVAGNPAAMGRSRYFAIALQAEKTFLLLPAASASMVLPVHRGGFAFGLAYSGTPLHNATRISATYGRSLGSNLMAGLQFIGEKRTIPAHVQDVAGEVHGGVLIRLTNEIITGMNVRKQIGTEAAKSKNIFHAGIGYSPSELLLLSAEVTRSDQLSTQLNIGLDYRFRKEVSATLGFMTGSSWWFGCGYLFSSFTAETVFTYHPHLGWTPSISISFQKKENEKVR